MTSESYLNPVSRRRVWLVLAGVLLGMLLAALDQTVVGTAMPRIIAELRGLEHYAWVFTAYMLASTVTVPIYGKLSDIYGRRRFFLLGMGIFLLGSALSGLSQTMTQLIVFRAVQGLGAGALFPIALAIVGDLLPPAERGKWQGVFAAVWGLTAIVGPTMGGWITDHWGWRWAFYVNMPVGAVALLAAGLTIPGRLSRRPHTIDYLGAATLIAGTVPLLLALSWAGIEYPWRSLQIVGLLALAAALLVSFVLVELRAAEPVVNPRLFLSRIYTLSVMAGFFMAVGMFGTILYLPLFIQGVLGHTATSSGAVLTPMMLGFVASSVIGGQLMARTGRYKVLAIGSVALAAVGMLLLSRMTPQTTSGEVVRNMVVTGLGIGTTMSLFTIVVQNAFPMQVLGEVTAGLVFFRSIGGTLGAAILGSVLTNRFTSAFATNLPEPVRQRLTPEQLGLLRDPQALVSVEALARLREAFGQLGPAGLQLVDQVLLALRLSLSSAITELFTVGAIFLGLALLVTAAIPEIPLRQARGAAVTSAMAGEAEVPSSEPVGRGQVRPPGGSWDD
ncbi:MFS transporter [Thermomicrobiaceae bacterium CFH 74404]|uniref:MFS transporter n=1 Tax=Thermalbibacter longus TaxID=2951981 RepID=A0AA42BAF7_9BACT|nr:MDR family MFS transporter [Thermalbibacter longus]MCM8749657.1 MFS transporter [Thermalbibacter longus]